MRTTSRPLITGRALVFVGMLLIAFNLRTAATNFSPLVSLVRESFPLSTLSASLMSSLPPASFALASLITPRISRRIGLTSTVLLAFALICFGDLVRALSADWAVLALGTLIALVGTGLGNVIMPPLVKKYFPDRIGLMTSLYTTVIILSATIPPLIAVPVASATSWRFALGDWVFLAIVTAVPWVVVWQRERRAARRKITTDARGTALVAPLHLSRSPTAWAIGIIFGVGSVTSYALYAWLPAVAMARSHVDPVQAGALVALYAALGIPFAIFIPLVSRNLSVVTRLIHLSTLLLLVGFAGMLFLPEQVPWLWATLLGAGLLQFPLAIALINLRTESQHSSLQLSGFAQSVAYISASVAAPLVGISYELSGDWVVGLIGLTVASTATSFAAFIIKRNRTVEQDLAAEEPAKN